MRSYLREELVQVILGHYDKICIKVYCALFSELDVAPHCILMHIQINLSHQLILLLI